MKIKSAIVLAAGDSNRMHSALPKALHKVCALPLPVWPLRAAEPLCEEPPVVLLDESTKSLCEYLVDFRSAVCEGGSTSGTIQSVRELFSDKQGYVLILRGDMPLLSTETLEALTAAAQGNAAAVLTCMENPPEEISKTNCGVVCINIRSLYEQLEKIPESELYEKNIGCVIQMLENEGQKVASMVLSDATEAFFVNDRVTLSECERVMRKRINEQHMISGVTMIDPERAYIDPDVRIGKDTIIYPDVVLQGSTVIGERVVLYPGCRIQNSVIQNGCVLQSVVSNEAEIGEGVTVGPFVNLRPGTRIAKGCKIGDFVEIKNSNIGEGSKVPHLSYVGDGDMGAHVNIGCGTVFSNYDGFKKHRTVIGDNAFIGCNTNLVAPVSVGNNAYTAAGSTITEDVPDGSMAFARARQVNKEGYTEKFRQKKQE